MKSSVRERVSTSCPTGAPVTIDPGVSSVSRTRFNNRLGYSLISHILRHTCNLMVLFADGCHSMPCVNRGSCIDVANDYMCNCAVGYTGVNCETGKGS